MLRKFTESMRERVQMFVAEMQAETGLSVVEMILILVVIIALVLIFKTQLTTLVNDIFEKIRRNYWRSMESLRWREVMKPVISQRNS